MYFDWFSVTWRLVTFEYVDAYVIARHSYLDMTDNGWQVCKEFLELSNLRSLWDALLQKVVQRNIPVPGLNGKLIESLSAKELEISLHRALTLRNNWISASPTLKRRISLNAPPQHRIVSVQFVPGDDHRWLISLSMSQPRSFVLHCWDLRTSTCIARRDVRHFAGMALNKTASEEGIIAIMNPQYVQPLTSKS